MNKLFLTCKEGIPPRNYALPDEEIAALIRLSTVSEAKIAKTSKEII